MKFIDLSNKEHIFELNNKFKVKSKEDARSNSQWKLGGLLAQIYGRQNIFEDYPLPGCGNLSWDFWVPHKQMAFEFHGRQHDEYVPFFHQDKRGFERQIIADNRKLAIAEKNGITLVAIREEDLNEWSADEIKEIIIRSI
jgi:hypothetical protein